MVSESLRIDTREQGKPRGLMHVVLQWQRHMKLGRKGLGEEESAIEREDREKALRRGMQGSILLASYLAHA